MNKISVHTWRTSSLVIIILIINSSFTIHHLYSQQIFINEGFEDGMPEDWVVRNEDGNTNEWQIINMSLWAMGGSKAASLETDTGANDWLISSRIYLQEDYILSFWATEIVNGTEENITVWLSQTGNAIPCFNVKLSDLIVPYLGYNEDGYLYTKYKIDLSDYQGKSVYVAWQLTSPNKKGMCLIDNITTEYTSEDLEWNNITPLSWNMSVYPVSTGGYITAGRRNGDMVLEKLNPEGAILWTTYTDNSTGDMAHSVVETFDERDKPSGYAVAGERDVPGGFNSLVWVCKYDTIGTLEWENYFGVNGQQNEGTSIKQTNDGGYIVVGYEGTSSNAQIIIAKIDKNGKLKWKKKRGDLGTDYASNVIQTADGGYAVTGFFRNVADERGTACILKIDENGNEIFFVEYPDIAFTRADEICETSEGGFIIATYNYENDKDWRIIKTDNIGAIEWEYICGGEEADEPRAIQQTAEGNYIIAGYKSYTDEIRRMWVVKIDNNGSLIWETEYETNAGSSMLHDIKQTQDGGYIFTGITDAFSNAVDGFIAKIKSDETMLSQNDILSFYLPEQTQDAIINENNHTVTITVNSTTNLNTLSPVIFTSPQSRIYPRSATERSFANDAIYYVTALDQTKQAWTIKVEGGYVGIDDNKTTDNNLFTIYPNPSNGVFTIGLSGKEQGVSMKSTIVISNVIGETIYNSPFTINNSTIDISNQPKGIYFIKISTGKESFSITKKIIIK